MTRSKKTKTPSISDVGETLVSAYKARLDVRQQRDKAAADAEVPGVIGSDGIARIAGRQTSPEMATLASKYLTFDAIDVKQANPTQLAADVRSLAASVLSQAHTDD